MATSSSPRLSAPLSTYQAEQNDPSRAGQKAGRVVRFGPFGRFAVHAMHTRFCAVTFIVADAETPDPDLPQFPSIIRMEPSLQKAVAGLPWTDDGEGGE